MTIQPALDMSQDQVLGFTSEAAITFAHWSASTKVWEVNQFKWTGPATVVRLHSSRYAPQTFQGLVSNGSLGSQADSETTQNLRSSVYRCGLPDDQGDGNLKTA